MSEATGGAHRQSVPPPRRDLSARYLTARGSESDNATMRFFANDSLVPRQFR